MKQPCGFDRRTTAVASRRCARPARPEPPAPPHSPPGVGRPDPAVRLGSSGWPGPRLRPGPGWPGARRMLRPAPPGTRRPPALPGRLASAVHARPCPARLRRPLRRAGDARAQPLSRLACCRAFTATLAGSRGAQLRKPQPDSARSPFGGLIGTSPRPAACETEHQFVGCGGGLQQPFDALEGAGAAPLQRAGPRLAQLERGG